MESKIKWQIGFPDIEGEYLVTETNGDVAISYWCVLEHYQYWLYHRDDEVVAWCKLSDIEPYKEETREEQKTIPPYMDYDVKTEESMKERKYANLRLDVDQDDKLATEATIDGNKITPPENYLIGKITKVDNGMIVEFVKKQSQYPKNYKECCEVLGVNPSFDIRMLEDEESTLYFNLIDLVRCRNAYWKIAGKQMGLGEPWEPDWKDCTKPKYTIHLHCDGHVFWQDVSHTEYRWLSFPTAEMRDTFYENFKKLIEECKELL